MGFSSCIDPPSLLRASARRVRRVGGAKRAHPSCTGASEGWARRKRALAHPTNSLSGHLQFPFFVLASPNQRKTGGHGNGQAKGGIAARGTNRGEKEMD